jgi:hypothetical protein
MTVLEFPRAPIDLPEGWRSVELQRLAFACAGAIAAGEASGWEVAMTECGDPQLYLLGPAPDYDCILCISRLGHRYVVEDGRGRLLLEHGNLIWLAEQAAAELRRRKGAIAARIAVAWCALREMIEEKTEAMMAEPMEILAHMAPQLAALA